MLTPERHREISAQFLEGAAELVEALEELNAMVESAQRRK